MVDKVVAWSPEALEDVDDIAGYIARDSVFYAAAVVEKMLVEASGLNRFPQSGRIVPELNRAVIHGRRLLDDAFASRLVGDKPNA